MNRLCSSIVGLGCVLSIGAELRGQDPVHGELHGRVTWQGTVVVDGDVVVPADGTLTIARGTKVEVAPSDSLGSGWNSQRVEIRVLGRLYVEGADEQPVVIGAAGSATDQASSSAAATSWHGIVLLGETNVDRSRIAGLALSNAFAGIQVPSGSPEITDSVFRACEVGIEVGSAYRDERVHGIESGRASPEIERCRFVGCHAGVYCEGQATPVIRNSIFHDCRCALGNLRGSLVRPLREPGMVVVHCLFSDNRTAVSGPMFARDSIWIGNTTAIEVTEFHSRFTTSIEHSAVVAGLFWQNQRLAVGEVGFGVGGLLVDPLFGTPLSGLDDAWPPIPADLRLSDGSPARGAGSDGRDLGPISRVHAGRRDTDRRVLSGETATALFAAPSAKPPRRLGEPVAGDKLGGSWWAVIEPLNGWIDLKQELGVTDPAGVIAAAWSAGVAGEVVLRVDGDLDEGFHVRWNGAVLPVDSARRRAGEPLQWRVATKAGENAVVITARGWGSEPGLAIAIAGEGAFVDPRGTLESSEAGADVSRARLKTSRRDPSRIELALTTVAHWGDDGRAGLVELVDDGGRVLDGSDRIVARIESPRKITLEQLPETVAKGILLRLTGLRRADGRRLLASGPIVLE